MTPSTENVFSKLRKDGNRAADAVARDVMTHKKRLPQLLEAAQSTEKRVMNGAAKALRNVSERKPELLAPHLAVLMGWITGDDTILAWNGMDITGNLAAVDTRGRIGKRLVRILVERLADPSLVTAVHATDNLGKIAACKPRPLARWDASRGGG